MGHPPRTCAQAHDAPLRLSGSGAYDHHAHGHGHTGPDTRGMGRTSQSQSILNLVNCILGAR